MTKKTIMGLLSDRKIEKTAIALQDEKQKVTYGELAQEVMKRKYTLTSVSILGLAMDNSVEWVLWDLAAQEANIICVPLPPFFTEEQITHAIQSAGISHIRYEDALVATMQESVNTIPETTSKITYTSGTTGTPKGVCLSHYAMTQVATSIVEVLGNITNSHGSILPFAVLLENVAGVYASLLSGCTITITSLQRFGYQYEYLHDILLTSKVNSIIVVPDILRLLMSQVMQKGALPDLIFIAVGGSKIDVELLIQAEQLGLPVYEGYGLSECASVISLNTPTHNGKGSVGKVLPHLRAHIRNNEIVVSHSGFLGYVGEPYDDSRDVLTGDLGELNSDGYLSITGRKKNVLITSRGRNISPEWVESILLLQPAIAQAIVLGDGEANLRALIVPSASFGQDNIMQKNTIQKINSAINEAIITTNKKLPDYAKIHHYYIVETFTQENNCLTGNGRPKRETILKKYQPIYKQNGLSPFPIYVES